MDDFKKLFFISWSVVGLLMLAYFLMIAMSKISDVITLFLYALIIVYILKPVVNFFEKKRAPRFLAVILSYLVLAIALGLIVLAVAPIFISQISGLIEKLPGYFFELEKVVSDYRTQFAALKLPPEALDYLSSAAVSFGEYMLEAFSLLPGHTVGALSFIVSAVLKPFFALIISFYILMDYETISGFFLGLVPKSHLQNFNEALRMVNVSLKGFLKGQALVILAVAILSWISLSLLKVEYAFALAFIIGLFDIIPYLGPIIGGGLAVIVAFFQSPMTAFWVIVAMVAIQQIEAFLISPNVMGKQVDLHPLAVLVAILIGGSLLGPLGILLATPVAATVKGLYFYFLKKRGETIPLS
ncbi:MAG: AI-2E family transporter [Actinomycetota bacterium]|nr:AI-2E family transporter [Actinomycetota bacterium]